MNPFWITFYSYKGGVGRSMALANLATLLARRSRRVFMIDFDLEAPGLDSFGELGVAPRQEGVVEYVYEFQQSHVVPDLSPYVQECNFTQPMEGKVWLLPSGKKDEVYNSKRIKLNWSGLYESGLGELFIDNLKAAIFRKYKPDYVFVDSRTGLTDTGGICTLHLPNLVILLFGLNDQNVHGISAVLQTIRNADTKRPPQILPVATPVPNLPRNESGLFKTRIDEAEKLLGLKIESTISYNPQAALVEKLFTLEADSRLNRLSSEYKHLLDEIEKRNPDGLDGLILKSQQACKADDELTARRVQQFLLEDFGERPDALFEAGQIERRFNGREKAVTFWNRALELTPNHSDAFDAMIAYYRQKSDFENLLSLYDKRILYSERRETEGLGEIYDARAQLLMSAGRRVEAAERYREIFAQKTSDSYTELVHAFNFAESKRRATGENDLELWKSVIRLFEDSTALEGCSVNTQANVFQAMHIAYACIGQFDKAKETLGKAERLALATGKAETVFSVKTYTYVSAEQFFAINKEMLEALTKGLLWDGMAIPRADVRKSDDEES